MSVIGNLVANLMLNSSQFNKGLANARGSLSSFSSLAASSMASFIGNLGASAFQGVISGLKNTGESAVGLAADAEQAAASFEVMTGSADNAQKLLGQLRAFGAATPFEFGDLRQSAQTLLQFGTSAGQVMPILRLLGDLSGGNAQKLQSMTLAFGQMSSTGRLMGQDLLQMINAGFNPLQIMAEKAAKTLGGDVTTHMARLKKEMEAGAISTGMVLQAMQEATGSGGRFSGMMAKQSQTLGGLWSTMKDDANAALLSIGQTIVEKFDLKGLMAQSSQFLAMFNSELLPGITSALGTIGGAFSRTIAWMRDGGIKWIVDLLANVVDFVANFDIYWQVAQQSIVLFASNSIIRFQTFFTNISEWLTWLGKNWGDVLATMADMVLTVTINMGKNLRSVFTGIKDWVAGKGFNPKFEGLTDGFHSSIGELPKLTRAAVEETTPELERLYEELGKRQAAASSRRAAGTAAAAKEDALNIPGKTAVAGSPAKATGLALAGSREALSTVFSAMRASTGGVGKKPEEKTADNTKVIASKMTEVAGLMKKTADPVFVIAEF